MAVLTIDALDRVLDLQGDSERQTAVHAVPVTKFSTSGRTYQ